jgi:tetrahydromethanopterin S-methyltransferase subunit E
MPFILQASPNTGLAFGFPVFLQARTMLVGEITKKYSLAPIEIYEIIKDERIKTN